MTNIALREFGGMMPRYGKQRLPNHAAEECSNALLLSGELRGLNGQQLVIDLRDVPYSIKRIYRALYSTGASEWITFADPSVDMVKGPLVNDAFDRYYYTSENDKPRMNTLLRLANDDPSYLLGIPRPTTAPTVTPDGTGVAVQDVTRAYVYTFLSAYGEEGAPSPATVATGKEDDTWVVTGLEDTVPDIAERNITMKNLYRTVSAIGGGVEYHFVVSMPLAQTSYNDTFGTDEVAGNSILQSQKYEEPPDDMIGLVSHPNGFLVGFNGRDLYFSEPYKPHAWPSDYRLATLDPIKGIGVYATSLAICTSGFPYICTGTVPVSLTFTKAHTAEPCMSDRRGVVSMPFGVYYPSANGLQLVGPQGFINATEKLITKVEWQRDYAPWLLDAVRWQSQYVAFYDIDDGLMFSPNESKAALVNLNSIWTHSVLQTDLFSGAAWMVRDNIVYEWNPAFGIPQTYVWKSKEFVTPKPVSFGAFAVEANLSEVPPGGGIPPPDGGFPPEVGEEYQAFNDQRFLYPLNPLNFGPLNTVRKIETLPDYVPPPPVLAENQQGHHDSPLFRTQGLQGGQSQVQALGELSAAAVAAGTDDPFTLGASLLVRIYADTNLVHEVQVVDQNMYRIPSGFKARRWQFEFTGLVQLKSFKIAETGTELSQI